MKELLGKSNGYKSFRVFRGSNANSVRGFLNPVLPNPFINGLSDDQPAIGFHVPHDEFLE